MSSMELKNKIIALQEWEAIIEDAQKEAEALKESIKAEMLARDLEELEVGQFIIRWTPVISSRFNTVLFKKEHAEVYKRYTKEVTSRRFTISL